MANDTINGLAVMRGRVQRPRVGNWVAELVVDAQAAAQLPEGSQATLSTDGGALSFVGTVLRGDAYAQGVSVRLVGGKNGLSKSTTPRFYRGVTAAMPVGDILKDAGEKLSSASQSAALGKALNFWTLVQQQASLALTLLANAVGGGCVWRVLADGTVFFGADAFVATALTDFELVEYLPLEGVQVIASENPDINPGESFQGRNVSGVDHLLGPSESRVRIFYES